MNNAIPKQGQVERPGRTAVPCRRRRRSRFRHEGHGDQREGKDRQDWGGF